MKLPRDILADLIEKRLWPIAVLLLAALVAVPLVLAKSPAPATSGAGDVPHPLAQIAASPSPVAPAVVPTGPAGDARLRGHAKNPFRQQHVQQQPTAVVAGSPATGAPATPAPTGQTPPNSTPPQEPPNVHLRAAIDVRFGKALGVKHTRTDIPRLTPLPNAAKPVAIFLGVRKDHETAVFLISSDVHAQGDGTCLPTRRDCQTIQLHEGDVALLDVTGADGHVTQYELTLVKVTLEQIANDAAARGAYRHVSRAGARVLRTSASSSRNTDAHPFRLPFRYVRTTGVLHIAPWLSARMRRAAAAKAAAPSPLAVTDAAGETAGPP